MASWRKINHVIRPSCKRFFPFSGSRCCTLSHGHSKSKFRDVQVQFTDDRVQSLLRQITGCDLDKIFKARKEKLLIPKYQLMTDEELKDVCHVSLTVG